MTAHFETIPAVDLLGDEAVRLEQGDFERVTLRRDPLELVRALAGAAPRLHLVDLDGARSGRLRPELVGRLVEAAGGTPVQASGGVRSLGDAELLLAAGATRVVVGTAAWAEADALAAFAAALGERLVVALDVRDGLVRVSGWERSAGLPAGEAARRCAAAGVRRILCTAVERDGTLSGPDLELLRLVRDRSGLPVLAAGGIRSRADLDAVAATGCEGAVVGRALLEGALSL